ncbi:MAG: InlB B-repeat-containing protein, partial [Bacteroidota bacterium]
VDDILLSDAANSLIVSADVNIPQAGTVSGAGDYVYGETVALTAQPEPGYTFMNWTEEGVEVSAEAEFAFEASANRNLTANFEITNAANTYELSGFRMYPNPTGGKLTIEGGEIQMLEICDLQGRVLHSFATRGETKQVNLSDLPKGLYIVRITSTHAVSSQKLVLE